MDKSTKLHGLQDGPASNSAQVPINGVTGHVEPPKFNLSGKATYRELDPFPATSAKW